MVILVWGLLECKCYNVNVSLHSDRAQRRTGFVHSCPFTNVCIRILSMSDALSNTGNILFGLGKGCLLGRMYKRGRTHP